MYIAARDEGVVRIVDLTLNAVVGDLPVPGSRMQTLVVSLDGTMLYGADIGRSKLIAWDLRSGSAVYRETNVGTAMDRNAFDDEETPDNAELWVSTLADGKVYVFERSTLRSLGEVVTGGNARYIGFRASGSQAVIANESGWVDFVR
jgi:DNA-binding beta-propeller fold protein YncE